MNEEQGNSLAINILNLCVCVWQEGREGVCLGKERREGAYSVKKRGRYMLEREKEDDAFFLDPPFRCYCQCISEFHFCRMSNIVKQQTCHEERTHLMRGVASCFPCSTI